MSRPNRIQYPGALYHVTARGNRRNHIFVDDRDHLIWLDLLAGTIDRFGIVTHAYVHMPNHYHLLVETPQANLSASMQHLNSLYAQTFNKRHGMTGHVMQGRFHAVLIEREAHLLELARYIALNPVRAELVKEAEQWRWSSYAGLYHAAPGNSCVTEDWLLGQFAGRDRAERIQAFGRFVAQGKGLADPIQDLPAYITPPVPGVGLAAITAQYSNRNAAMLKAYRSGGYSVSQIAEHFGVSEKTVRRAMQNEADS
ncbi:REP-associated tyrosine transposase [Massilia endophytica]|uniref:REP-associated tyrosine transposase n=1 Tax=Massilia endophytica TaxID=2899220 RepID=UPI001E37B1F5|nr:transposase [Massilia endophytica]UGQ47366.1 transposase [Massilia endophytica]